MDGMVVNSNKNCVLKKFMWWSSENIIGLMIFWCERSFEKWFYFLLNSFIFIMLSRDCFICSVG